MSLLPASSLIPPNATALERALEALAAARSGGIDVPLRPLWSAQDCPPDLLPWLAWAVSIDSWDAAWPVSLRRARVASAIGVQRIKGTRKSVEDVVRSFGGSVGIREWWQVDPPAEPHTFDLLVSLAGNGGVPSADFIDAVIAEVRRTKPARSHFTFTLAVKLSAGVGLQGAGRALVWKRVRAAAPVSIVPENTLSFAGQPLTFMGEYLTVGS